jgi:hypothetical protein
VSNNIELFHRGYGVTKVAGKIGKRIFEATLGFKVARGSMASLD